MTSVVIFSQNCQEAIKLIEDIQSKMVKKSLIHPSLLNRLKTIIENLIAINESDQKEKEAEKRERVAKQEFDNKVMDQILKTQYTSEYISNQISTLKNRQLRSIVEGVALGIVLGYITGTGVLFAVKESNLIDITPGIVSKGKMGILIAGALGGYNAHEDKKHEIKEAYTKKNHINRIPSKL